MDEHSTHKECVKCHQVKPISDFRFRDSSKNSRKSECHDCYNEYMRLLRNNPEIFEERKKLREEERKKNLKNAVNAIE